MASTGRRRRSFWMSLSLKLFGVCILAFLVANVVMGLLYWQRALPNYYLGSFKIAGIQWSKLGDIPAGRIIPASITFTRGSLHISHAVSSLGVSIDIPTSTKEFRTAHNWLPLLSLIQSHHIPLKFHIDDSQFAQATKELDSSFYVAPVTTHIAWDGSNFVVEPAQSGYQVDDAALQSSLLQSIQDGVSTLAVPSSILAASTTHADLSGQLSQLQQALSLKITLTYRQQEVHPTKADIGGWYAPSGQSMAPSADKLDAYLRSLGQQLGITIANQSDLATALLYVVNKDEALNLVIVPATNQTIVRTYCTAVLGESTGNLDELNGKLAATYADVRGWNDSGRIAFQHASGGCQYTVWLSAASQVTSFGAICDNYYNCQVGNNVILNYDRWATATPPWNATGRNLEDYRTLMINHETGHRLGFIDNPTCPGSGQLAPVMMQQSIDLKGCVFNNWPLASEFAQLNSMLGIG